MAKDLDSTVEPAHARESGVGGDERCPQRFSQAHVHRVPTSDVLAEFPCPFEKIPVTEALAGPVGKALDRLGGGGGIQPAVGPPGPRTAVSVALTV